MKELSPSARQHLSLIHHVDVVKILEQLKVVAVNSNECKDLQGLTDSEYEQLIQLLDKYQKMLDKINLTARPGEK